MATAFDLTSDTDTADHAGDTDTTSLVTGQWMTTDITTDISSMMTEDEITKAAITSTDSKTYISVTITPGSNFSTILLDTGLSDLVTRAAFLSFFTVIGFISNCILLTILAQSNRRRFSSLNLLLISLAAVNLLDCLGNMPLILGASISQQWDYGEVVCKINAFSVQFASMATVVGLCALSIDRCVGVQVPSRYPDLMSLTKVNLLIVYTWVQAAILNFPVVFNLVPTKTFKARYLCSVTGGGSLVYICITSIIGYIIPILIMFSIFMFVIHKNREEKKRRSEIKKGKNYSKRMITDRTLRKEINTSKYVGVLIILWALTEGPYLLFSYIQQYIDNMPTTLDYPWQLDLALTWIRFSYPLFLPLVTFCWRKDIWQKVKNIFLCRKGNLIDDDSVNGSPESRDSFSGSMEGADSLARKKEPPTLAFNVPVLFATEQGLHVQTLSKKPKGPRTPVSPDHFGSNPFADVDDLANSNASAVITARKCDVNGSQDLLQIDDDTSDYDSSPEEDPLTESNPVSENQSVYPQRTSSSSRHNSEIMLISESKSFDNEAFDASTENVRQDDKVKEKSKHIKQNSKDNSEVHGLVNCNEVLPEDEKSLRHVRSSSDSGRGSEEGTMCRRESSGRLPIPSEMDPSQTYANIDDVTTNETSTDVVGRPPSVTDISEEQPKVKKKRRKRRKALKDEEAEIALAIEGVHSGRTLPKLSDSTQHGQYDKVQSRPPIRLKPIEAPPSPVLSISSHQSPAKLPKKLPSPYKTPKSAPPSGRSPKKSDLLQVQPEDGSTKHHQRSDSEASAIIDSETTAPVRANLAARRRRTNTLTKATSPPPDVLAQSDVTDSRPRDRYPSSSSEQAVPGQRLTHSDSAADIRTLSPPEVTDTRRSPRASPKPSPRPSPRPRKPRRKSDIPKADGKPPIAVH